MLYLDANASEPVRPAAKAAAVAAMEVLGNPSSIHSAGRAARKLLEDSRETVAAALNARSQDVIFTSGATEANALAIAALGVGRKILIGATEHDAIRAAAPGAVVLPVRRDGMLDLDVFKAALVPGALVCVMAANNETGVIHDLAAIGALCAEQGARLHVDAVQEIGRAKRDYLALGATSTALSGHKFGGIQGAGALVVRAGVEINPVQRGGGQELGRRGGTPALPAIAALAAALNEPYEAAQLTAWRDEIEEFCVALGAVVVGAKTPRLPNTLSVALPGVAAQTQLIALDMAGIAVSAGSACSSGKLAASHVLQAMGLGDFAAQTLRISLPWNATADCVPAFCAAYANMANRALRSGKNSG